jgi:hypothetical protein
MRMEREPSAASGPDMDDKTGQPIEEAEKNLSRHSTRDSSPPRDEKERTTVGKDPARPGGSSSGDF